MVRILYLLRHFPPEKSGMATQMFNTVHFIREFKDIDTNVVRILVKTKKWKHSYVEKVLEGKFFLEKELTELKKKFSPDIAHIDSIWPHAYAVSKVFDQELKVISIGGRLFDEYREYWKYTKQNPFIGFLKGKFLAFLAKYTLNNFDIIIAEGTDIKQHLRKNGIKTPIAVINNGIDVRRFRYVPRAGKRVLFFGRLSWENGPDIFLEIMKLLPDFEGIIIGYGPMESEVREKAKKLKNVKVKEAVPWEKVPELLASVDFVVMPFRRIGGISQTVTEAMAAGRVVLTTKVGDLHKPVEHGKTGFFFSKPEEAAQIIRQLSSNLDERRKIERKARRKIEREFNWRQVIKKYHYIYKLFGER